MSIHTKEFSAETISLNHIRYVTVRHYMDVLKIRDELIEEQMHEIINLKQKNNQLSQKLSSIKEAKLSINECCEVFNHEPSLTDVGIVGEYSFTVCTKCGATLTLAADGWSEVG